MSPDEDWTTAAACRDHMSLFDLLFDRRGRDRDALRVEAAAVCRSCEVRVQCRTYAAERVATPGLAGVAPRHLFHGYWAGDDHGARDYDIPEEETA